MRCGVTSAETGRRALQRSDESPASLLVVHQDGRMAAGRETLARSFKVVLNATVQFEAARPSLRVPWHRAGMD
eukprot:2353486-Prymnesium_polylepis.1